MKTLCCSVRLESLTRITPSCYKARSHAGKEALIPASQVFGQDWEVSKCEAWWISQWILERKKITWSGKKQAWFDESGRKLRSYRKRGDGHIPAELDVPKHVGVADGLKEME